MQKIKSLDPYTQSGKVQELFNVLENKFGFVPNLAKTMGHSSAALVAYLSFRESILSGVLGSKLGEQIAISVANVNGSDYDSAAHSFIGKRTAGLNENDIILARNGNATDIKTEAALTFSRKLLLKKGKLNEADFNTIHKAGFSNEGIIEIIAHTALAIFTNYFTIALELTVDFPLNDTHN